MSLPVYASDAELRDHQRELGHDRDAWCRMLLASKLPPGARLVAFAVSLHTGTAGHEPSWASYGDLERETGLSVHQVRYYVDTLQQWGYLERHPDGALDGRTSQRPLYLRWPEPPP